MKRLLFALFAIGLIFILHGCGSNNDIPVAEQPQMLKLAPPILINPDSTVVVLSDYFQKPGWIDSVDTDPAIMAQISPDSTIMVIRPLTRDFPKLTVMKVWSKGFSYALLLEKSTKIHYWFTFDPKNKKHKTVQIAGQMNDWNPASGYMFQKEGKWHIDLHLFPGKYQYKLVIDGKWKTDPHNPDSVDNNNGGYNSLLVLGNQNQSGFPQIFTKTADGRNILLGNKNNPDTMFVFWENYLLDSKFLKNDSNGLNITIPKKAKSFDRSFIRIRGFNSTGISNDVMIPLRNGKVIMDPKDLTRADKEAMVLYFLMVDRFKNGDPKNDAPVRDSAIDPRVNYMGGDLEGITKAIDDGYFTDLGVNTLWISPVTQNPLTGYVEYPAPHRKYSGYHGYWPITLTSVDSRFGTGDEMHQLVKDAHGKGINVILDFVSHHVHQDYPPLKGHPDWITQVDLPGKKKNIRIWDEQRLTTWFDIFLPTFDLTKPEVAGMVSDSAAFWIKQYNIDGFRHDAAKHVPEYYWRMLTGKLSRDVEIPEGRSVFQIGESFGSRELVKSYINPGMLDAQFEFNLYWDARSSFALDNSSFRDLNYALQQSFNYFGEHNLMGNITGNQDMSRFISYASGALTFSEDDREAGWKRDIQVKDTIGYRKMASLMAFNMTIPGLPVIYYGDEIGMAGAGDPDNRRMMKFDSLNKHEQFLKSITAKLIQLRRNQLPLIYGDFTTLKVNDKVFVYLRSYFGMAVVIIFNKDKSSRKIEFELPDRFAEMTFMNNFGHNFNKDKQKVSLELENNSFEILTTQTP